MCSILFAKRLSKSPYSHFSDPYLASSLLTQFSREFSQILGQSFESPLYTCVTVGSTALPMIMKLSTLMKDKSLEWSQTNELPVTLPLLESQHYHSTFICPVTKEHGTDLNPPMMLLCGHVLGKESLMRLAKGSSSSRFKCPYCPVDSTAAQAVRIYF
jgi:E3 ubiquitin-protein transferase RMND5